MGDGAIDSIASEVVERQRENPLRVEGKRNILRDCPHNTWYFPSLCLVSSTRMELGKVCH